MKLIRKTKIIKKITKNNTISYISFGIFKCLNPICNKEVEKRLGNGYRDKSCGCIKNELIGNNTRKVRKEQKQNSPMKGKHHTEETKNKIRRANKGKISKQGGIKRTKITIQKLKESHIDKVGILVSNWQGGKSFEIYPKEFKQIRKFILKRDLYQCQNSNCEYKSIKLDTHHIDYNKQNNDPENLITLCISCHMKTNGKEKRQYFTEFYQNIMINRIIECLL